MPRRRPQQELEPVERWAGWHESLRARDQAREEEIDTQANRASERLNPLRFCRDIDAALPDNGVLVADGGDFVATASYYFANWEESIYKADTRSWVCVQTCPR